MFMQKPVLGDSIPVNAVPVTQLHGAPLVEVAGGNVAPPRNSRAEGPVTASVGLELQNRAQSFIDGVLQARWQRTSVLGQKTAVEGHELGDIHNRIAGKAGRAGRHKNIAWDIGKFQVAGDHGHDYGLNAAAVEGVCLDHKHGGDRPTRSLLAEPAPTSTRGPFRRISVGRDAMRNPASRAGGNTLHSGVR